MNNKLKTPLLIALIFCVSLISTSTIYGSLPNSDVEKGAQLVESKIDFLIALLEEQVQSGQIDFTLGEDFKNISGLKAFLDVVFNYSDVPLNGLVEQLGQLHDAVGQVGEFGGDPNRAIEANEFLNQTIVAILNEFVEQNPDQKDVVDELIALLSATPEAYGPTGIVTSTSSQNLSTTKEEYALRRTQSEPDPDPEPEGNFRYYGTLYDLDNPDETIMKDDGTLEFTKTGPSSAIESFMLDPEGPFPSFLTPLFDVDSLYQMSKKDEGVSGSGTIREYSWNVSNGTGNPAVVTAKLFESTETPPIVFDYYNEPDVIENFNGVLIGAAGLSTGDKSSAPGEGVDRSYEGIGSLWNRFLPASVYPITYEGGYTSVGNLYGESQYSDVAFNNIMLDTNVVFMPYEWNIAEDEGPSYRVSLVTRSLVVDSGTVDEAMNNVMANMDNPEFLNKIYGDEDTPGEYCSGGMTENPADRKWNTAYNADGTISTEYTYYPDANGYYKFGLQTIGQGDMTSQVPEVAEYIADFDWIVKRYSLDMLKSDGLLAYIVQVEEDRVNRKIQEIAKNSDVIDARIVAYRQKGYSEIRARDAAFVELADAQSGKVMKDVHGNWVRAQQYILRPDTKTLQLLSVSLRGGDGELAGMSTIDFTTNFTTDYAISSNPKDILKGEWLNTIQGYPNGGGAFIFNNSGIELASMYVKITNPGDEYIKESRYFASLENFDGISIQGVQYDELSLSSLINGSPVYDNIQNAGLMTSEQLTAVADNPSYSIDPTVGGFTYNLGDDRTDINVKIYTVGDDSVISDNPEDHLYPAPVQDMWAALGVNERVGNNLTIGTNQNLEIAIDSTNNDGTGNFFENPIDVIYIPMSRMIWKDDVVDNRDNRVL